MSSAASSRTEPRFHLSTRTEPRACFTPSSDGCRIADVVNGAGDGMDGAAGIAAADAVVFAGAGVSISCACARQTAQQHAPTRKLANRMRIEISFLSLQNV